MKEVILKLLLNESEGFVFKAADPIDEILFCDDIEVDLLVDERYRLLSDCFQYTLRRLIDHLDSVINCKLLLHKSIQRDLGFLWDEYLADSSAIDFYCEEIEGIKSWIGTKYILFETPGSFEKNLTTWLYNNEKGEIILEITPGYKWHFQDPELGDEYFTYEEFIKNYKPILFRTIPKVVAEEWLVKLHELLKIVEK